MKTQNSQKYTELLVHMVNQDGKTMKKAIPNIFLSKVFNKQNSEK